VNVIPLALMEKNGKLGLSHQARNLFSGSEASCEKGRQGGGIQGMSKTLSRDQMPVLINKQSAFGLRLFDDPG
jgi:hypothetical protein